MQTDVRGRRDLAPKINQTKLEISLFVRPQKLALGI